MTIKQQHNLMMRAARYMTQPILANNKTYRFISNLYYTEFLYATVRTK